MALLILDNYDSFTYNLVHLVEQFTNNFEVHRNDQIELEAVAKFDAILLSPGPGLPEDAGILLEVVKTYAPTKKILGVCLGLQSIAQVFQGNLTNLDEVLHGVTTKCQLLEPIDSLFAGLPREFRIGHYHSWVVDEKTLHPDLQITARDADGSIMGLAHRKFDVRGVQFHPESVMTEHGLEMIRNWLAEA